MHKTLITLCLFFVSSTSFAGPFPDHEPGYKKNRIGLDRALTQADPTCLALSTEEQTRKVESLGTTFEAYTQGKGKGQHSRLLSDAEQLAKCSTWDQFQSKLNKLHPNIDEYELSANLSRLPNDVLDTILTHATKTMKGNEINKLATLMMAGRHGKRIIQNNTVEKQLKYLITVDYDEEFLGYCSQRALCWFARLATFHPQAAYELRPNDYDGLLGSALVYGAHINQLSRIINCGDFKQRRKPFWAGLSRLVHAEDKTKHILEKLDLLLTAGADINSMDRRTGETALSQAVRHNRCELVKCLRERGADFHIGADYHTPLILALTANTTYSDTTDMVNALGATPDNLNAQDGSGLTLAGCICSPNLGNLSLGNHSTLSNVLAAGVDPSIANNMGQTPLHNAVEKQDIESCKVLLRHDKVDVNAQDRWGNTPLHYAVRGREEIGTGQSLILLLIEKGADPHKKNLSKRSPYQYSQFYDTQPNISKEERKALSKGTSVCCIQ